MNESVRTRFAPSPTGDLHVGSLRTALYSYLFAKKESGTFILRIEDTDQKRFVPGSVESLIQNLQKMGVSYTEGPFEKASITVTSSACRDSEIYPGIVEVGEYGPYIQSERRELYKRYVDELVSQKKAYRCFCTPERLEVMRTEQGKNKQAPRYDRHCLHLTESELETNINVGLPHVIRFLLPENREIVYTDLVRGEVKFHTKDLDDHVLMKSDSFPTYHLAAIVDDHLMGITHVLRSEEWLPSTPKHILLYEAFGWDVPLIGHLSVILAKDGKKKLSKRDGGVSVDYFLSQGYLKEALINFIVLLGWNPGQGNTQEIFSLEELEKIFSLSGLHKAGAVFDLKKLDWMNGEYIKKMPLDELYGKVVAAGLYKKELIKNAPAEQQSESYLMRVLTIERDRLVTLIEVGEHNPFFFTEELSYDGALLNWKQNTEEMTKEALTRSYKILAALLESEWEKREVLEKILLEAAGEKRGDFLWPLRVALTGAERSPSPFDVAWVLGKEVSLKRLESALQKLS